MYTVVSKRAPAAAWVCNRSIVGAAQKACLSSISRVIAALLQCSLVFTRSRCRRRGFREIPQPFSRLYHRKTSRARLERSRQSTWPPQRTFKSYSGEEKMKSRCLKFLRDLKGPINFLKFCTNTMTFFHFLVLFLLAVLGSTLLLCQSTFLNELFIWHRKSLKALWNVKRFPEKVEFSINLCERLQKLCLSLQWCEYRTR